MAAPTPDEQAKELGESQPPEENQHTSPPTLVVEDGIRGLFQVIGVFCIIFNIWGANFAFGSFQSFYTLTYLPSSSASAISWIGTVQAWLLIVGGLFSGPLLDLGYYPTALLVGSILSVLGFMMLSLSREYYSIFLSQGICMGAGFGLLYIPSIALVSRSFARKRALALGIATSGAPAGGIIYTIMFNQLISNLGFGWTVRVMGFLMLALFIIAAGLLLWHGDNTKRIQGNRPRRLIDFRAIKDLPFWSFTAANFFLYLGYITPYYYIPTYAQTKLGTSRSLASYILIIAQGASIIGRVGTTVFAHYYGSMISWVVCGMISGILCLCWISADSLARFIAFAAFYGKETPSGISGALIPLPPSVFPHVCPDPQTIGTWLGMAQSFSSFASLIGPPIAGALASIGSEGSSDLNFLSIQLFSGIVMAFGACELLLLWYLLYRLRDKKGLF
ncbi:hypothetical protein N7532_002863 [Penicillium argentinense]|uniref:Major facilitator superfamily (MFS) profile domain-containing protein n=1 Tax=Penicillium argentinense TaxID=1131581 RepID=A0A9W9KLU3_9EURO|nr:uncharacterized protein N7532_002863 [Penicillium argentinense]KAJ5110218.1 hypothetical protein N7532_002863 [Penicillium argentinense]